MTADTGAPFHWFDLAQEEALPSGWDASIKASCAASARATVLRGGSSSTLPGASVDLPLWVIDGAGVRDQLPWLWELYHGRFIKLAAGAVNRTLYPANRLQSTININVLPGPGGGYEWHVDTNSITAIVFVDNFSSADGGELLLSGPFYEAKIVPKSGILVILDGAAHPHCVLPVKSAKKRTTVVMNYYYSKTDQPRPSDLDDYLYGRV